MTHGDGWTTGGMPIKVDTKATWLEYVAKQPGPYIYRRLDSIQVELHGDFALTVGRYKYLPRSTRPTTSHLYVWFERAYAKHNGEWQFLSHRTVKGPVREDDDPKSPAHNSGTTGVEQRLTQSTQRSQRFLRFSSPRPLRSRR